MSTQPMPVDPPRERAIETGIPRERFVEPEWHDRDLQAVFRPRWHYAAHGSEIDEPGSYVTVSLGDDEIVITRASSGRAVAYYNFCRHRGHPLVTQERGQLRRNITCQYHGWSYSKDDGACIAATRMPERFDKSAWGLRKAWVEEWHRMIFVSFGDRRPISVADSTKGFIDADGYLGGFDLDRLKLAATSQIEIAANWKLVVENDDECYHCALNHPGLVRNYNPWSGFTVVQDLDKPQHLWTEDDWSIVNLGDNKYTDEPSCQVPLPRRNPEDPDFMTTQFFWQPSGHLSLNADYAWLWSVRPLGPERTALTQQWLVADEAEEGRDYDVDSLTEFFETTMREDEVLCNRIQKGFRMRKFEPGPLNPHHQGPAIQFYRWYQRCLGEPRTAD